MLPVLGVFIFGQSLLGVNLVGVGLTAISYIWSGEVGGKTSTISCHISSKLPYAASFIPPKSDNAEFPKPAFGFITVAPIILIGVDEVTCAPPIFVAVDPVKVSAVTALYGK